MSNQRGVSLVEIMIASLLAAIVSGAILMITRMQLIAYEQNDQVARAQQNQRAGLSFVEGMVRRACGGIANGRVAVNVAPTQKVMNCLTVYDGAALSGGSFTNATASSQADAVEVIYGTPPFTSATAAPDLSANPSVQVADKSGFAVDDLVLLTDYGQAVLLKISAIAAGATAPQGTLSFASPGGAVLLPSNATNATDPILTLTASNTIVMKAVSRSLYLATAAGAYRNMLMLDPDGALGSTHSDAQPLVENIIDLQVAMGVDGNSDGTITENLGAKAGDEWLGNAASELPLAVGPWNRVATTDPQLRWVRLSFVFQTGNSYPGTSPALPSFEDRSVYPTMASANPRYRPARITVAPRVWNLLN